jgi:hypothetical protein
MNNRTSMNLVRSGIAALGLTLLALLQAGCVVSQQAPTIAHVHVGHAITAAHDTPAREGYLVLAEQRALAAASLADDAVRPGQPTAQIQATLAELNRVVNDGMAYPLTDAIKAAASHIRFAADSEDASANVRAGATAFEANIDGILYRNNLINLYVVDALASASQEEVEQLAGEIRKLVLSNQSGEDVDGNGTIGDSERERGMIHLRRELEAMIAREEPAYRTVDSWYLFNLIRLPNGSWMFRRSGSTGGANY